uniref:Protein kinase domain-containing protein n=2 Tax=Pundamilia nyererei TaxID=303518 RepID=A0A3B4FC21_9CICH
MLTFFSLVPGGWLSSNYQIISVVGEGTYGRVAKCVQMANKKIVAIKMIKDQDQKDPFKNQELAALQKLKACNSSKYNIVEWYQAFTVRGHLCLEFEFLEKSLFDLLQERYCNPLSLKAIRPIVIQIALALSHLKSIGTIHADLKLENVMLVNNPQEPYRVKLIDFGLACETSAAKVGSYIQTRPYRSPEIILGLPFTEAIDIWSLGCMAVSLYTGYLLYPGYSEHAILKYITETQGELPEQMLNCGQKTAKYFCREFNSDNIYHWKLKTTEQYFQEFGIEFVDKRVQKLKSLDELLYTEIIEDEDYADATAKRCDILMFVDMVKHLLHLDPRKRITPNQVLEHAFSKLSHLAWIRQSSSYVESCYEHINYLRTKKKETPGQSLHTSRTESAHKPTSDTRQSAQRNFPPSAAERKTRVIPHSQNGSPHSTQRSSHNLVRSSQSENSETIPKKAQCKRKHLQENEKDTSDPDLKRKKTNWKDVRRETLYQHERSDHDQQKRHDSMAPSCATTSYRTQNSILPIKRKPDESIFATSNKRARTNCENGKRHTFNHSWAEDHR